MPVKIRPTAPAFPQKLNNVEPGIDTRTYLAAKAMQGILASRGTPPTDHMRDVYVAQAVGMADALIARLNATEPAATAKAAG
jgi:hypothetical protein